uniref:Insulin-like domain-containing protein n=1 Tax=Caenorhabditis japonica TaxID=281687 RepID=A0A8R1EGZ7_CAEJA
MISVVFMLLTLLFTAISCSETANLQKDFRELAALRMALGWFYRGRRSSQVPRMICGSKLLNEVRAICKGECVPGTNKNIATLCCGKRCTDKEIAMACCPTSSSSRR